ncbi:GIY-YIG nuclease family protein [Candidatus Kaiserbacteria bacterium]|nr:GIY-YIG nuclease family protein [Candidatus Kaiserbacteria bacterium]
MPGSTTKSFEYVYVLQSKRDRKRYIGYTTDLRSRYREHVDGAVPSTAPRRPLELIYYEACLARSDARRRERYLKSTNGRKFLSKRLRDYYKLN